MASSAARATLRVVPILRQALLWIAAAAAFVGASVLNARAGFVVDGVPLLVPVAGVAFSAVQLGGPWIAIGVFAGGVAEGFREGMPVPAALLLGVAAAGTGLAGCVVPRAMRVAPRGERYVDTLARGVAAGVAGLLGASLTVAALAVAGTLHEGVELWGVLTLGAVAGILTVSPFVRSWTERRSRGAASVPELVLLVLIPAALAAAVLTGLIGSAGPTAYLVFPIVVWAALRTGRMGVSGVLFFTSLVAVQTATNGRGPFVNASALMTAVQLDSFIIVLTLTGLLLAGLDLERRETATGLNEAEERHRRLIEQLPLVTYERSLEPGTKPRLVSPQTVDLLGYPLETWMSEPYFAATIVHPEDRELHAALNARSFTEDVVTGEYRMIAADGRVVWILDHMVAVRDETGKAVAQQGFVIDITERKELEEQLVRAHRIEALGLLAGGVAHDFNNLLTAIGGYTGLALEQVGKADDLVRRHLAEVQAATGTAAELTRRLLAFGRRQVLDRAVIDLNDVVGEAHQLLAVVVGEDVELVTELEHALPSVRADRGQLVQVLLNLATNARDAMPGGGRLTIRTASADDEVVLAVSDTGTGMDEETLARAFEPFFTTKPVGEGTGLGLAMVHGIVQQSGGRISPATETKAGRDGTPPAAPARERASETVLLVEDEEVVRRLTAELLERQGYRVLATDGPDEALRVAEPWDLLLTDVVMPSMTGPELAERLAAARPDAAVLFTSGYSGGAVPDRGALGGDLLEKPFTVEELAVKVRAALDARPGTTT
jgi:PAS domain S-box-containing protein